MSELDVIVSPYATMPVTSATGSGSASHTTTHVSPLPISTLPIGVSSPDLSPFATTFETIFKQQHELVLLLLNNALTLNNSNSNGGTNPPISPYANIKTHIEILGDGQTSEFEVVHGFGAEFNLTYPNCKRVSTGDFVQPLYRSKDENTLLVQFGSPPMFQNIVLSFCGIANPPG
jgi:hypothetical protein